MENSLQPRPTRSNFRLYLDEKLSELNSNSQIADHQHQQQQQQQQHQQKQADVTGTRNKASYRSLVDHTHVNSANTIYNTPQHQQKQTHLHSPDPQNDSLSSWSSLTSELRVNGLTRDTPAATTQKPTPFDDLDNQSLTMGIQEKPVPMTASRQTITPVSAQCHKKEIVELKHGSPLKDKSHNQGPTTTVDIDGLLAEGKAAAVGQTNGKCSDDVSKDYVLQKIFMLERLKKQDSSTSSTMGLEGQRKEDETHDRSFSGGVVSRHSIKDEDQWYSDKKDQRQTPRTYNEHKLYEPPKRVAAIQDYNKTSPTIASPVDIQAPNNKPQTEHEFLRLTADEVEELRIWLVSTGYHDIEYRRKVINRHKRLAALEQERLNLIREEKLDREAWVNRSDVGATPSFTPMLNTDSNALSSSLSAAPQRGFRQWDNDSSIPGKRDNVWFFTGPAAN